MKYTSKNKDITSRKFGKLTALDRLHNIKGRTKWLCICDCGNLTEVKTVKLTTGHTRSCGCLQKEITSEHFTKHGRSKTRLYKIWQGMKKRCYNVNTKEYSYYGGRGIKVCEGWCNDFQTFYDWSMENGYNESLTIDRINYNGNYEPNNCRWTDYKTQNRNSRHNKQFTINGEARCLSEWCEILNLNYKTVLARINQYNWTIEQALELIEREYI